MRNMIILVVVFGIVGLVLGYLIFGRRAIGNELIPLGELFSAGESGVVGEIKGAVTDAIGYAEKRRNIYLSGGVGGVVGLILGLVIRRRR